MFKLRKSHITHLKSYMVKNSPVHNIEDDIQNNFCPAHHF